MFVINGLRNLFSKAAAMQRDATKEQSLMRSCDCKWRDVADHNRSGGRGGAGR